MNRKRLSILLALLFAVQAVASSSIYSTETYSLNPPTRVSLNEPQFLIKKTCEVLCLALFIYKLDVVGQYHKNTIIKEYGDFIRSFSDVKFDLDHMDIGKNKDGLTRYYPFSVDGKYFIARIFYTDERTLQPDVKVLYEWTTKDQVFTLQILPGTNEILSGCKIKPHSIYSSDEVDGSV